jgi:transcriptional regulator with GAF, ATPase, and Fis domain
MRALSHDDDEGDIFATVQSTSVPNTLALPGAKLEVVEGPDQGRAVTACARVVRVGKAPDNDLVLSDESVSRHHCEVRLRGSEVRLVDLGSTNGTTVDGVRAVEVILSSASLIRLGSTSIRVSAVSEPLRIELSRRDRFGGLLGTGAAMREVFSVLERVAPSEATVLLEGESGTGKELAAEGIHAHSARVDGPFVTVDCGAIAEGLIESELFGHVRGAFTGAIGDRVGLFEQAHGGTLFLDEVGELPLALQPKLLRALEKRQVRRVGSSETHPIDVRVVAATNRDLAVEVNRGTFREDLFFRLAVVRVKLPPLRQRAEDVPMLVRHFVDCLAPDRVDLSAELVGSLAQRSYPGNVRELRNAVERALALASNKLSDAPGTPAPSDLDALIELPFKEGSRRLTEEFERRYLERAMRLSGGSVSGAARIAGLSRRHVHNLLRRHGLRFDDDET